MSIVLTDLIIYVGGQINTDNYNVNITCSSASLLTNGLMQIFYMRNNNKDL
jgi:hypothetical protein